MDQEKKENVAALREEANGMAQTQESTEGTKNSTVLPDKFKDTDALVQAYNSLQAEFTRRSQRLKELERLLPQNTPLTEVTPAVSTVKAASAQEPIALQNADLSGEKKVAAFSDISEEVKQKVIEEYLSEVKKNAVPLTRGGVSVATPALSPKSVQEAGNMALSFLKRA